MLSGVSFKNKGNEIESDTFMYLIRNFFCRNCCKQSLHENFFSVLSCGGEIGCTR